MSNSIQTTLGELVSKEKKAIISGPFGSNIGKIFFKSEGIPVIRGNNLSRGEEKFKDNGFVFITRKKADELNCYAIKNDVIFTAVGTIGQVGIIDEKLKYDEYVISNKQLRVRFDTTRITPLFAYYWFSSYWIQKLILQRNVGSTVPLINLSVLKGLPITIPESIKVQNNIVEILENISKKIELNNQINSELEAMAKTLYDYWFVQFDFPYVTSSGVEKPYKSSGGKMVWNEELKREIPEGWEVLGLEKIENNIVTGKTPSTSNPNFYDGNIPFITIGDVRGNMHIVSTEQKLTIDGANQQSNKFIPKGAICVTCIASPGLVAFATADSQTNQQLNSIVCKNFENRYYLYFYLTDYFKYSSAKTGNTFANMNKGDFSVIKVIKPKKETLVNFSNVLKSSIDRILINSIENQELASLRDWLLPMLMNGQVRVGDVEEELGMVAEENVEYQLSLTDKDKKIRRKMLATYIINQSLNDTSFGKTKFEKLLHLIECHIVKGDYNQRYSVQAAGPYDGGFTKVFWNEVTKAKWFKIEEFGKLKRIMPAENHSKSLADYGYLSDDLKLMINDFIDEFKNTNYERPEIVSTLFAVWNNRIIRNEIITDELLKKDFLEWDTQKAKYLDRLDQALEWMRENAIIPNGWGKYISRAKSR